MQNEDESPLKLGDRHAAQAELAEREGRWTSARDKHIRALKCFEQCLGMTSHPQANQALHALVEYHRSRSEKIKEILGYETIITKVIEERGYTKEGPLLSDECYQEIRNKITQLIDLTYQTFSHFGYSKNFLIKHNKSHNFDKDETDMLQIDYPNSNLFHSKTLQFVRNNNNNNNKSNNNNNNSSNRNRSSKDEQTSQIIDNKTIIVNDNFYDPSVASMRNDNNNKSNLEDESLIQVRRHVIKREEECLNDKEIRDKLHLENLNLKEKLRNLDKQLIDQTVVINQFKTKFEDQCRIIRQSLDNIYHKGRNEKQNRSYNSQRGLSNEEAIISDTRYEMMTQKLDSMKKHTQHIESFHKKQIKDLREKLQGWVNYARKLEERCKVYLKQIEMFKKARKSMTKPRTSTNNSTNINNKNGPYARGTLSRRSPNANTMIKETPNAKGGTTPK